MQFSCHRPLAGLAAIIAATWGGIAVAAPAAYTVNGVLPDFSQTHGALGPNYCAPTAGADEVYWFSLTYPSLRQGNPVGPGAAADAGVDNIIGPNPPANGTLAKLMNTSIANGTTLAGLTNGWGLYLNANGGNTVFTTQSVLATNFPVGPPLHQGLDLYNQMEQDLSSGSAVILCLYWLNNQAPGGYDNPSGQGGDLSSNIGHALALYGYNTNPNPWTISVEDPANNAGIHNWNGENAVYNVAFTPTDFRINFGGATGVVYGYSVATPIPEPASLTLLAATGLGLLLRRRRS